jgi:hypothetical protein
MPMARLSLAKTFRWIIARSAENVVGGALRGATSGVRNWVKPTQVRSATIVRSARLRIQGAPAEADAAVH